MMQLRVMLTAAVLLVGAVLAGNVGAAVRPHAFYLTPQAGAYFFNSSEDLKDSAVYSLGIGYQFSPHWSSEIDGSFVDSRRETGQKLDVGGYLLRLDTLYHFRPDSDFVPYLAVGVGGLLFDFEGGGTDLDGFRRLRPRHAVFRLPLGGPAPGRPAPVHRRGPAVRRQGIPEFPRLDGDRHPSRRR